ncbi:MAG: Trk system potassium transporter TrkA [Kordiimonas sp.]|nr:Trk system potassium transporter TrkA [Kordiimonas sp.]|tara:strand:+ start:270 stop:1646 length:1377 start_codon:yes stop_codon:yes gene_type:complete
MKVIVCGAGQVGFNIAKQLAAEQNDVTVIDRSPKLIRKIGNVLDVQALVGYASHPDVLEQAGARDADMIIAVTLFDEVNMMACQVAHSLFSVPTKVARVRSQSYLKPIWQDLFSRENMPIDVIISPEVEVARAIMRRLEVPGAFDMIPFADDAVRLLGIRLDENCPLVNTPLRQLTELFPDMSVVVCGISRGDKMIVPSGDDQLLVGDDIYVVTDTEHMERAMAVFGHEEQAARRIVIFGGGNVSVFLTEHLLASSSQFHIKIIEANADRAEAIAERLPKAVVLQGDALDTELQNEANVQSAETVIAVTNDDEVNILSSLLAKQAGCSRAITLTNNQNFGHLMKSMGIDAYVDPRETTVSSILQHIRRGRIRGLQNLAGGMAEIIEAEALETSPLVGKPLRDIRIPDGIMVGAIVRDGEVVVPRGGTVIQSEDKVIIFALSNMVKKVESYFSVRLEFF